MNRAVIRRAAALGLSTAVGVAALATVLAAIAGARWIHVAGRLLPFAVVCRFPLLLALALVGLPLVSLSTARPFLGSLFVLRRREIALVALLATFAAWVVMVTLEIFLHYAPARSLVAVVEAPAWLAALRVPLFALLAAPIVAATVWRSPPPRRASLGWAALGATGAGLLLVGAAAVHWMLRDPAWPAADFLVPGEARLFAGLPALLGGGAHPLAPAHSMPGYLAGAGRIGPGHLLAAVFFLISAGIYVFAFLFFRPGRRLLPALAYLLQLLIVLGWALPGISFLLDRYRVPVLSLLAAASFIASRIFDTDHYYWIERLGGRGDAAAASAAPAALPAAPRPAQAFVAAERAAGPEREQPVVVVASSGGGSAAALWTARVLTGLQVELGPSFTRSIRLLSAVSGGSVGALFFLDRFTPRGAPDAESLAGIVAAAGRPSLDAAAWGLAYADLWRVLGLRWGDPTLDRGWAMEQVWRQELLHPEATLGDWRSAVAAGWLPAAVFNATTIETGEQFLFSPLELRGWQALRFADVYRDYDLAAVTAARISAGFPWVSPVARALCRDGRRPAAPGFHLGDGGYYDNFGVVTAVNWLRSLTPEQIEELKRRGLLLVLIRAYPEAPAAGAPREVRRAWLYSMLGPVLALMRARSTTQSFRNGVDLALLRQVWSDAGIRHEVALFSPRGAAPLTWKLVAEDRAAVLASWESDENRAELARVRSFCGGA
jgi:hypothetical protein